MIPWVVKNVNNLYKDNQIDIKESTNGIYNSAINYVIHLSVKDV